MKPNYLIESEGRLCDDGAGEVLKYLETSYKLNFTIKWDLETHEEPNMRSTCIVTTLTSNLMT